MSDSSSILGGMPAPEREAHLKPEANKLFGLMAEFESPAQIVAAAEKVRDAGYRWWDCHTPFPVHGLDQAMGIRATILPVLVFFGGLTGAIAALVLQIFTNATSFDMWAIVWVRGYDYFISGKPMMSIPAFIPVTFELTVLLASLTVFFGLLLLNGLPRLYHPVFKSRQFARASDDRFFLVIEAKDPQFSRRKTEELLQSLKPLSIEALDS